MVEFLTDALGIDINHQDSSGKSALTLAVKNGGSNIEMVKSLAKKYGLISVVLVV